MGYNTRNDEIHENLERMAPGSMRRSGFARYRAVQRPAVREEDRVVLANGRCAARLQTSLADHRLRLRHW
jgi:hypothetical protein